MSNTVACFKWVLDSADIRVAPDGSVNYSSARESLSEYDAHAMTAAADAAAALGGKAYGLTFSPEVPRQLEKDVLSRQLDELVYIKDESAKTADAIVTAEALATAIGTMDDISLVVCSEGASDTFARQTPSRVAALLDWPVVTSVCAYEIVDGTVTATRRLEDCMQVLRVKLPAVISVLPEANAPKIPGMKAILEAGRKPVEVEDVAGLGVSATPMEGGVVEQGYIAQRKNVMLDGDIDEVAEKLRHALQVEGVL